MYFLPLVELLSNGKYRCKRHSIEQALAVRRIYCARLADNDHRAAQTIAPPAVEQASTFRDLLVGDSVHSGGGGYTQAGALELGKRPTTTGAQCAS